MPEISFTCSDEDHAWLAEQAQALGIDDIGITVRVVVRNARQRNQSFGIVANGENPPRSVAMAADAPAYAVPPRRFDPASAATEAPIENAPAEDFEVEAALDEATQVASEALETPQPTAPIAQPSTSWRQRAQAYKASTRPALVYDGPGSRTQAISAGDMVHTDPRLLHPHDQVRADNLKRQMDGHFAGLRRA
jgi:hypothetical protein